MARKQVKRHTKNYQFRDENPVDQHVYDILNYWKADRREVTTLRKAVALYHALEQGDFGALLEAFPQYKGQVNGGSGGGGFDTDKLATEIAERVVMLNGSQYQMQPPAPAPTGKLLSNKVLSAPVDDDDDLPDIAVTLNAMAGAEAARNFMKGLQGLH